MERVILQFTEPQLAWMRAEAKRLDLSLAEWARRVVDQVRGVPPYQEDPDAAYDALRDTQDAIAHPIVDDGAEVPTF